jgi:hypothetical protein
MAGKQRPRYSIGAFQGSALFITFGERIGAARSKNVVECRTCLNLLKSVETWRGIS